MKQKLTITVDEELIPRAKRHARAQGISLSELVERRLRAVCGDGPPESFSMRWRGRLRLKPGKDQDDRYRRSVEKYS